MSLGSLYYKIYKKFQHGLGVAYYRDVVRPRILTTKPVLTASSSVCEIHVLTSATDWINLLWALKSFYFYSGRNYALCIHDDGTLEAEHTHIIREHFPNARLIERQIADQQVEEFLRLYPKCLKFRQENHLAPKVFDFLFFLESDRLMLLDSDVLFFASPEVLLQRLESLDYHFNSVNTDVASAYTVEPGDVEKLANVHLVERFNSGLGVIQRDSLRMEWLEEFLALPEISGHFWRIEQTLFALCSSRFGVELLPEEYNVRLDKGIREMPSRHYVGPIRHLMYGEGIAHLARKNLIDN